VRFDEELVALEHGATGVRARTADLEVDAAHAVLALPLPPLGRVAFEPALPAPLARAIAEVRLGAVTKTFVRYPAGAWGFAWVVTRGGLQRIYDAAEDQKDGSVSLDAYVGGDAARELDAAYPEEERRVAHVAAELARIVPELDGTGAGGLSRSWTEDPRFGGSFSVWGPGQVTAHWRVLREPHGRVRLAGEHASTVCGYVEGAIESGRRAARGVLAAR
jgi:monoamine oxidase